MGKTVPKNSPCPCGSGKKYKHCCMAKDTELVEATQVPAIFMRCNDTDILHSVTSLESIPPHNKNGLSPAITPQQMMTLCIDKIYNILKAEKVGTLSDLVNRVVMEMNIVPIFTYRQIAECMQKDKRFASFERQIFSLAGTDPLDLMADKLS